MTAHEDQEEMLRFGSVRYSDWAGYAWKNELHEQRGDQIKELVIKRVRLLDNIYLSFDDTWPFKAVWMAGGSEAEDIYLRVKEFLWSKRRASRPVFSVIIPSKIYLVKKHETSSFWKRNWEKLLLLVIGALVTLGVQWVWGRLAG